VITAERLRKLSPLCPVSTTNLLAPALEGGRIGAGLNTGLRVAHFMAQVAHESAAFTRLEENLNYSAERLHAIWPKRFPTVDSAALYARNPVELANKVYGGRLGNDKPGDGWRFRGRGLIQLTGRANYEAFGIDDEPEVAALPKNAALLALAYWKKKALNDEADRDDIEAITRAINGGLIGLEDRKALLVKAKRIFT
jgi:putative chitinase